MSSGPRPCLSLIRARSLPLPSQAQALGLGGGGGGEERRRVRGLCGDSSGGAWGWGRWRRRSRWGWRWTTLTPSTSSRTSISTTSHSTPTSSTPSLTISTTTTSIEFRDNRINRAHFKIPDYVHMSLDCRRLISRIFVANPREADGWIVEPIKLLSNPNNVRPKRFWGVYTKLKIFNMTRYKKVVYLDADTIVVKSIEDLFKCGKFCANLKHSERMNSGIMDVEPSEALFKDMMSKVKSLPSYTGGDQGFLNSYYADFPNAHVFDPNLSSEELKSKPEPELQRLSTLYNADVGLYMLANKEFLERWKD